VDDQVQPTVAIEQKHPTQERLHDQIAWYDRKSQTAQRRYKTLKLAQMIIAALIPLASVFPIPAAEFKWVMAVLGLLVLIIEAVQQLNQDQQNLDCLSFNLRGAETRKVPLSGGGWTIFEC
jgi:hypothetical protein